MKYKVCGQKIKNMPWQEKPEGWELPLWRYNQNPIIKRNPIKGIARIFNSAVVYKDGEYVGVFRAEDTSCLPHLRMGYSKDGINWKIDDHRINMVDEDGNPYNPYYAYDPRLVKVDDTYYIIWCTEFYGPTIGLAETKDFKTFVRRENCFLPYNRNGVLFPRKINGKFVMMSRPSDGGHTAFGDIFISESSDLTYWGKHRHVMEKGGSGWWQGLKIGGGPAPIETSVGWLLFYHGVILNCNGYVYSIGGVILDKENPSKVLYRCRTYLLTPEEDYESVGFVPNVCFPCATLVDEETGRVAIYYGAADTYVALAFTTIDEVVDYIIANSESVGRDGELGK